MSVRVIDEMPGIGFGWIAPEPAFMQRASHAILSDGRVWVTDPVYDSAMLARIRELGTPAGVVRQLDRHGRDGAKVARELGVPLLVVPDRPPPGAPFEVLPVVDSRAARWHEVALWFPTERVVSIAEAIGGAPYFLAPGEQLGPHPLLRLVRPPTRLIGTPAQHVICGHGRGLHAPDAGLQMSDAIRFSRARSPRWLLGLAGVGRTAPSAPDAT